MFQNCVTPLRVTKPDATRPALAISGHKVQKPACAQFVGLGIEIIIYIEIRQGIRDRFFRGDPQCLGASNAVVLVGNLDMCETMRFRHRQYRI